MTPVINIINYVYDNYPSDNLSLLQLKAILYLADWKYAIEYGSQMTNLSWMVVNNEPQITSRYFEILINYVIRLRRNPINLFKRYKLSEKKKEVLDFVIASFENKTEEELERLIHSTYPVVVKNGFGIIDLTTLAKEYEQVKPLLKSTD